MLAGGYKEGSIVPLDGALPSEYDASTEDYDYLSDSDLDDEEERLAFTQEGYGEDHEDVDKPQEVC